MFILVQAAIVILVNGANCGELTALLHLRLYPDIWHLLFIEPMRKAIIDGKVLFTMVEIALGSNKRFATEVLLGIKSLAVNGELD